MDRFIDARFERLEKSLSNLIDSITKYHPSTLQAEELKAADDELHRGLKEVEIHQNNYLRIQKLRESSNALDSQIRDTLSNLASTRKDIVNTHTTTYATGPSYPVVYNDLLSYARRISKTTMPPAGTINGIVPGTEAQTPAPDSVAPSGATPIAPTPSQTQSPMPINGLARQPGDIATRQQPLLPNNTNLPEGMDRYMNVHSGQLFFPWPLEDKIRSGSLAANQMLVERGIDPRGFDPAAEEERKRREEEERKEREEKEKAEREERERKMMEERERVRLERERQRETEQAEWRRGSVVGTAGGADAAAATSGAAPGLARSPTSAGEKKQFQFTNLDDLDDDDDD